MKLLSQVTRFELDEKLKETAEIFEDGGFYHITTSRGYDTREGNWTMKNFDQAFNRLKTYERQSLADLKYN